jgi:Cu/Ag efflux protein CusF
MRRRLSIAMVVCLGICMAPLAVSVAAQDKGKKEEKGTAKLERVEGNVHQIDKATKTVTVTLRGKGATRDVVYSDKTMFTFRNKPSTLDEVKDGRHVICLGNSNDKKQLVAARIDVRDEK